MVGRGINLRHCHHLFLWKRWKLRKISDPQRGTKSKEVLVDTSLESFGPVPCLGQQFFGEQNENLFSFCFGGMLFKASTPKRLSLVWCKCLLTLAAFCEPQKGVWMQSRKAIWVSWKPSMTTSLGYEVLRVLPARPSRLPPRHPPLAPPLWRRPGRRSPLRRCPSRLSRQQHLRRCWSFWRNLVGVNRLISKMWNNVARSSKQRRPRRSRGSEKLSSEVACAGWHSCSFTMWKEIPLDVETGWNFHCPREPLTKKRWKKRA